MKRSITLTILLLTLTVVTFGQATGGQFLRPVDKYSFIARGLNGSVLLRADQDTAYVASKFLVRPSVGIVATRNTWNKDLKKWEVSPLDLFGAGVTWEHYQYRNGVISKDFGITALLMAKTTDFSSLALGLFGSYQLFQLGCDIDNHGVFSIDTGIKLTF